jgi:hypothetical protein
VHADQVGVPDLAEGFELLEEICSGPMRSELDCDLGGEEVIDGMQDKAAPTRTKAAEHLVPIGECGEWLR